MGGGPFLPGRGADPWWYRSCLPAARDNRDVLGPAHGASSV